MKKFIKLPDSELALMLIIWEIGGSVSTSDIMRAMTEEKSVQVVQTYLGRLENKGFIAKEKLGRLNFYQPLIEKSRYRENETSEFMSRFYNNSSPHLFASLLKNNKLTQKDLEEIQKIIDEGGD